MHQKIYRKKLCYRRIFEHSPSTVCSLRELKTSRLALVTEAKGTRNPNPDRAASPLS
jgi:hypothetical protein